MALVNGKIHPSRIATSKIKNKLRDALGTEGAAYWNAFTDFMNGRITRPEMEYLLRQCMKKDGIVALHNAFLLSILREASVSTATNPAPPSSEVIDSKYVRKRKRILPYQGPEDNDEDYGRHSKRLKQSVIGMGMVERDRLRRAKTEAAEEEPYQDTELAKERAVQNRREVPVAGAPPLSQLFCTANRTLPTSTALEQLMTQIAVQHGLSSGIASNTVSLMKAALEAHLKTLSTRALALNQPSLPFNSIRLAEGSTVHDNRRILKTSELRGLMTISPYEIPVKYDAVYRLSAPDSRALLPEDTLGPQADIVKQHVQLLRTRSAVKEVWPEQERKVDDVAAIDDWIERMV